MEPIAVETLRTRLEEGRPVTILDVRPADQRAEWAIPGSVHIDAYRASTRAIPTRSTQRMWPVMHQWSQSALLAEPVKWPLSSLLRGAFLRSPLREE